MPDLPESGIRLVAENQQFDRAMRSTIDGVGSDFDSFASDIISGVDEMESAFDSFSPTIEMPDADMLEIPDEIDTTIHAEPDEESGGTFDLLKGMAAGIIVFEAIINVAGTILDVLGQIQSFTLDPILDVEDAMARFEAQTGRTSDGLDEIINRLHFSADVGEGFDDITNVLITGNRLGIESYEELEEAALGALQTAKSQGVDAVGTLRTMQILVDQGLAGSFTEAADLVTVAIQNGNDRAGDLFATINQFAPMFSEMGLSGEQAMSLINSGLDAGFRSASDVARAIDTMNKNITGAEAGSAVDDALQSIGLELPAQGEQVGEDFFNSVIEGIQANPEAADAAIEAIFGGRADKVSDAFGDLTLEDTAFDDLEGRAEEAATNIDNSLRGVFDDFVLWIQGEISKLLNSAEVDLPGKLEELRTRLQGALTAIQSGEGFGEALEIALQVPGLNDTFQRIESGFGNFAIVLLEVVASLADLVGQGDAATDARVEVTRLAEGQLAFDIKVADNAEDVARAVSTALGRGVEMADIQGAIDTAVTELIDAGDIAEAQALLDTLEMTPTIEYTVDPSAASDVFQRAAADALARNPAAIADLTPEDIAQYVGDGILIPITLDTGNLQEQVDRAQADMAASTQSAPVDPTVIRQMVGPMDEVQTRSEELANHYVEDLTLMQTTAQTAADNVILSAGEIGAAVQSADDVIHQAVVGGSIVPDIRLIATTALSAFPQVIAPAMLMAISVQGASMMVSSGLMMIRNTAATAMPQAAGFVNNLTQEIYGLGDTGPVLDSIISKLSQLASVGSNAREVLQSVASAGREAASVVNNTNTTVNVTQNNNVQSAAQAASLSFATGRQIRGFG
jgi:hypothetical protein